MEFMDAAQAFLEHKDISAHDRRVADSLRGLFSQHGYSNPTFAYQELKLQSFGLRLETKFGAREPVSGRGLRVRVHLHVNNAEIDDKLGACTWGYALHVVNEHTAELDSVQHCLSQVVGGTTPPLQGWLDAEFPTLALLAHVREHGLFEDRGKQLGTFIRQVLEDTTP